MDFTQEQLAQIVTGNTNIDQWFSAISAVLDKYEINTPLRLAGFIAQCAHESSHFSVIRENLNYRAESLIRTFPTHFSGIDEANTYAHQPEMIANRVYANRMGNGDEASGDGWKFCGKGLIQLTGHDNYAKFGASIGMSVDDVAAHLTTFEGAADSAGWFWYTHGLNAICDTDDILAMTKKINGGTLGLDDRTALYNTAKQVLGA